MLKIATNMSRRREIEAPSNARIVFGPGPFAPLGPPTGALPLDPTGGLGGPRPPAQLGPMEISADGPSAHQQKFPTISLRNEMNMSVNLRSSASGCFVPPLPKKECFKHSMRYSGCLIWNCLPDNVKSSQTAET